MPGLPMVIASTLERVGSAMLRQLNLLLYFANMTLECAPEKSMNSRGTRYPSQPGDRALRAS